MVHRYQNHLRLTPAADIESKFTVRPMCVQSKSGNQFESSDNKLNLVDEHFQECGVFATALKGIGRTLSERVPDAYFDLNSQRVNCQILIGLTGLEDADYVVVLDWFRIYPGDFGSHAAIRYKSPREVRYTRSCYLKKPVFVGIGQVSDDCQERRKNEVLPVERLQSFKNMDKPVGESFKNPLSRLGKFFGVIDDDECDSLFLAGRHICRVNLHKGMDKMVERGSEIVEAIADDYRPSDEIRWRPDSNHTDAYACSLRATLEKGFITATVEPMADFSIDRFEMFFSAV
jgi:hypothetical protein